MADIRDIYMMSGKTGHMRTLFNFVKRNLKGLGVHLLTASHHLNGADPSRFYKVMGGKEYQHVYAWRI